MLFSAFLTLDYFIAMRKRKAYNFETETNLTAVGFSADHFYMACIGLLGHFWDPYPGSGNPEFFLYCVTGFVVLGMLCGAQDVLCFCHC